MEDTKELASRWSRLGGAILDDIAIFVIFMPLTLLVGSLWFPGQPDFSGSLEDSLLSVVRNPAYEFARLGIFMGVFLLLNGYFLIRDGQSIGKKVIGMRIVNLEGKIPPFTRIILLRHLVVMLVLQIPIAGMLLGLADVLFIFRPDKRCIHDHLAGTVVVKA